MGTIIISEVGLGNFEIEINQNCIKADEKEMTTNNKSFCGNAVEHKEKASNGELKVKSLVKDIN